MLAFEKEKTEIEGKQIKQELWQLMKPIGAQKLLKNYRKGSKRCFATIINDIVTTVTNWRYIGSRFSLNRRIFPLAHIIVDNVSYELWRALS